MLWKIHKVTASICFVVWTVVGIEVLVSIYEMQKLQASMF
jgi:hypothetical protein